MPEVVDEICSRPPVILLSSQFSLDSCDSSFPILVFLLVASDLRQVRRGQRSQTSLQLCDREAPIMVQR
jgi:hypothetical protein